MHPTVLTKVLVCSERSSMVAYSGPSLNEYRGEVCMPSAHHTLLFGREPEQKSGRRLAKCYVISPG